MELLAIQRSLRSLGTPERALASTRFFKTGKGQYGEGDQFLGVTMGQQRALAKHHLDLSFLNIEQLLTSSYHEERMTGLLILVYQFDTADAVRQKQIFDFYIDHLQAVNNWDLVDATVPHIIGRYLLNTKKQGRKILYRFARKGDLWERRIAILSTFTLIRNQEFEDTLAIATILLDDSEDLIHKAVGWMLREVGKRNHRELTQFLDVHAANMPRTMLRYAIEQCTSRERSYYLKRKTLVSVQ